MPGKRRPAKSPKDQENKLINLAIKLAEKQLQEGTASAQVITHFLKLATTKEQLENEKLRSDLKVAEAKINQINMMKELNENYKNAINAMKIYSGEVSDEEEYD